MACCGCGGGRRQAKAEEVAAGAGQREEGGEREKPQAEASAAETARTDDGGAVQSASPECRCGCC